jgi:nitroreductase
LIKIIKKIFKGKYFMRIETVRIFQKNHKITYDTWLKIFNDIRYTPSSFNLQPWRFFVFESEENKKKLKKVLQGNSVQLETSSAIVLVCGNLNKKNSGEYIYSQKVLNGEITNENKELIMNKIKHYFDNISFHRLQNEIFLEGGIISLNFVLTLQNFGYNSCFMGGCDFKKINTLFNIPDFYTPMILIAVGKAEKDVIKNKKAFKLNPKEFVSFL